MQVNLKKSFLFHLGIVLLLCLLLFVLFFAALHKLTAHGKELKIPYIRGKNINEAIAELRAMHFQVSTDSTYEPAQKPLTVLKQIPDTGTIVKEGRTVFLTVNMLKPSKIPMPNLVGLSFASAKMLLKNTKLLLGDTTYKPDVLAGSVLEQRYDGIPAWPGKLIQQGSRISLVLGSVTAQKQHDMPDVTTQTLDAALSILGQYHLQVEVISRSGQAIDTAEAIVVDQDPKDANEAGVFTQVKNGSKVVLTVE